MPNGSPSQPARVFAGERRPCQPICCIAAWRESLLADCSLSPRTSASFRHANFRQRLTLIEFDPSNASRHICAAKPHPADPACLRHFSHQIPDRRWCCEILLAPHCGNRTELSALSVTLASCTGHVFPTTVQIMGRARGDSVCLIYSTVPCVVLLPPCPGPDPKVESLPRWR